MTKGRDTIAEERIGADISLMELCGFYVLRDQHIQLAKESFICLLPY